MHRCAEGEIMRWEDFRTSSNVEDRRGMGIPGGAGGLGMGTIMILGLVGWALGIDPRVLIGGAEMMTGGGSRLRAAAAQGRQGAPQDETGRFAAAILGNTEDVWKTVLPQQVNRQYQPPKLVLFSDATRSGCGGAQSAMGPFYCPLDQTVYIDLSFFQEMQRRFRAGGDFAYAYVLAHEVGHHVENQLGILPRVQERQQQVGERRAQPALRPRRADGRLPRRRLGAPFRPALEIARAGRHRGGDPRRRRRSATTGCSSRARAASCPTASPTAPPSSACAG